MAILKSFFIALLLLMFSYQTRAQVKQAREVIEAYAVCNQFQQIMSKDLNFSDAFEATFAKDEKRRREIALRDGEFGGEDLSSVDTATLVGAYKNQMQLFYLMLPLASPADYEEERLFFPSTIKEIFKRDRPESAKDFQAFAAQLEKDVVTFRSHLNDLSARNPRVAQRVENFKHDALTGKVVPPKTRRVTPERGGSTGRAVWENEPYYQLESYTVVREGTQMKIVAIRFFTKLF